MTRPNLLNRRSAVTLMALMAGGCRPSSQTAETEPAKKSIRTDVPLRIVLTGISDDAEAIRLAWGMSSEQPLDLEVVPSFRDSDAGAVARLVARLESADLAIVEQLGTGMLAQANAFAPVIDRTLDEWDQTIGPPLAGLRKSVGRYGGDQCGIPVGGSLLAVLSIDSEIQPETWDEYRQWVGTLDGKAAEPLGGGWAASSFLNRCASTIEGRWLFDRSTMEPQLATDEYVNVLEQLSETAQAYDDWAMTPKQIWQLLKQGKLRGGIGFQFPDVMASELEPTDETEAQEVFDVTVSRCPSETQLHRLWFDPATQMVVISEACRQTEASKRFIQWLVGGQGNASLSRQIASVTETRNQSGLQRSVDEEIAIERQPTEYERWLSKELKTRQYVNSLVLPGAEAYYRALDLRITECLSGEANAKESLSKASQDWQKITDDFGRDIQIANWRKVG